MRLENQVAVVTGGGQGIGREIALRLAGDGARVLLADINEKGCRETADRISNETDSEARVAITDIVEESQVSVMIQDAMKIDNRIDILVNNSGIAGPIKNIEDISLEDWDRTMAINLRGAFLCCKHVIPHMKKQKKGSIVNIASITGKCPLTQRAPYAASKMGVIGLTRTLAAEVGKWNIRVNAICPGSVEGPRQKLVFEGIMKYSGKSYEQVVAEKVEATPLKALIHPKFVAGVVSFLCSEDAAMMTGQDINVSGGRIMY